MGPAGIAGPVMSSVCGKGKPVFSSGVSFANHSSSPRRSCNLCGQLKKKCAMTKEEGKKKKAGKRVEKKRKRSEEEEEDEEDEEEEVERRRKRKGKGKERVESETETEWREWVEARLMYVERVMCEGGGGGRRVKRRRKRGTKREGGGQKRGERKIGKKMEENSK